MRMNLLEALSDNIKVDKEKCTFCGICVETCILDNLRMKLAPCRQDCPLKVNCQGYVRMILRGQEAEALAMVERELPFPGILGRLCSAPCEGTCHRKSVAGEAVAIRRLKQYLVEANADKEWSPPDRVPATGKRIAVVGAGPAGMVAAWDLLVRGHGVTIFDAEPEPGGMLRWAVPEFRLPPEELTADWARLDALGVEFRGGTVLGKDFSLEELSGRYDAVIVALGCPKAKKLGLKGEDVEGVFHALDFLREIRAGGTPEVGAKVVVIGGGEVALDAAHSALRLGAASVTLAFLESEAIMPASPEALALARSEGIELEPSWGPTRIVVEGGRARGVEFQRCLAVYDEGGAFAPSFDDCTLHSLEAETVIIAVGQESDPAACGPAAVGCDPVTLQTAIGNVFLAGDAASGPSTIVRAMASGREAAESAHRLITGEHLTYGRAYPGAVETEFDIDTQGASDAPRIAPKWRACGGKGDFAAVEEGLTREEAVREAGRCYSCGQPFGKYRTCWFCLPCEVECPHDAMWVEIPYLLR